MEVRTHKLTMGNFFLIHRWTKAYIPFALYTDHELRRIHSALIHPSIAAISNLLKRADNFDQMDEDTKTSLREIGQD